MKQPERSRAAPKHVILFLAANPAGTDPLALDQEARSIHAELKRSGYRDRFDFVTRWAVEPLDLLREVRDLKPTVIHFSGHGGVRAAVSTRRRDVVIDIASSGRDQSGLYFHSASGGTQLVSPDAIAHTLNAAGASVRLVVLNACFSEVIADAILAHVDCVVGMSGSINDDAARSFAVGFYGGLGEHESIAAAVKQGRAAINLDGLSDVDKPQLKVRAGVDANHVILAAVTRQLRVDLPCPYPGMRPYTADDAAGFHGRDAEIDELIGRIRAGEREIYVIGPSGSGKSSLVAAGVLPRLARGVAGLVPVVVRTMRPGEQPAARLREALDESAGQPFVAPDAISALLMHRARDTSVLLVIDQLEEVFTLATTAERDAFLAALRALRIENRFVVILTLRADFFGALMESPLWPERGRDQFSLVKVSPLRGEGLREAITTPAHEVGVTVEPSLIDRLVVDAAFEPGLLPLLQETLVQLWDKRVDQTLTLADYEVLGDGQRHGLAVTLSRRADATLRNFSAAQTDIARRILLRLISFGEGRPDTRRQQPQSQLRTASDEDSDFVCVLQTMIDHRLLTIDDDDCGEPHVDLSHEVMIAAWPMFGRWIQSHRVDEQRRRQLEAAAIEWAKHGRGVRGLLDPIELADAVAWQQTTSARQLGQSGEAIALITASAAAHTWQRRRRRVIAAAVGLLGLVAVIVAAAALAARDQKRRADELVAQSFVEAGRQLLVTGHYQEAVPYLLAARQHGEDSAPLRMMFWEAKRHLPLTHPLEHQAEVQSAAFSPDGARVVTASGDLLTASGDKAARVWDATTGKPLTSLLEHQAAVVSAAFSPDGARVVTASVDKTARVWDAATGKPLTNPLEHQAEVLSATFSPDGARVVTASVDKTARLWDAATGKPLTGPLEHQGAVVSAEFSPDGARVVTASVTVQPSEKLDHLDRL
jgi:CHAT domain/WD domain, G-beta repeat